MRNESLLKRTIATLLLAGALAVTPVVAQEAAGHTESAESKSSEAGEKPGMELWKWANFAILAGILGYLISKNMGPMLVSRSQQIQEGLAAGERAKAEADARAAAVMAKLAGLDQAVAQMKTSAKEEREREVARLQRQTAAELTRMQNQAQLEIESAGKLARLEVQRAAARAAIDLAEHKVRAGMNADLQNALIGNFSSEIASAGTPKLTSHDI